MVCTLRADRSALGSTEGLDGWIYGGVGLRLLLLLLMMMMMVALGVKFLLARQLGMARRSSRMEKKKMMMMTLEG